jgi:hypothetical protein
MKSKIYILFTTAIIVIVSFAQAQQSSYLSGKATVSANPTFFFGNLIMSDKGELFLGSNQPRLHQKNTLFKIGNYMGKVGAKIHVSIIDNSNNHGTRGFFDIVGTATGNTEIILDMFDDWDGSRIDLARAHNIGSNINAFTMQETFFNGRFAQLQTRVESNDRIWFIVEPPNEDDCLPLILQKKNNTLVVDNNVMNNGGYFFVYYKWFRNNEFIHEGAYGAGLGGIYNTGKNISLSPYDTYHVAVIDQYGKEHLSCPYNPTIFFHNTRIIAYPNPTTLCQSLVMVDVETGDEELLANGHITPFNVLGQQVGPTTRTNGHRITPVKLPAIAGTYVLRFVSGQVQETIKIMVK